jgi:murein DD-endopeptidase MepM/ murein hydrolase activator NlpD
MSFAHKIPPPLWILAFVIVVALGVPPRATASAEWRWPVSGPVVREFQRPPSEYSEGHRGIDIGALKGREVRSPVDGTVWFSGVVAGRAVVSIDTASGVIVSMEPVEAGVVEGDVVASGEPIGVVSGTHDGRNAVHIGVRVNGVYENPRNFLGDPVEIVVYDSSILSIEWLAPYARG